MTATVIVAVIAAWMGGSALLVIAACMLASRISKRGHD